MTMVNSGLKGLGRVAKETTMHSYVLKTILPAMKKNIAEANFFISLNELFF